MSSVYNWSRIAANNANADSSINWAEGQAPSTVNNSARVMMTRLKELLDDLGGVAVATGTANAIAVTAASGFSGFVAGVRLTFRAVSANTGATTLNVNGVGQKPIVKMNRYGEQALAGAEIQAKGIYEVVYTTILNGGAGAWLLLNPTEVDTIPPGAGAPYYGGAIPAGWLLCNGSAVSRTTYARLFAAIGTTWGAGNGSTTFNLPPGQDNFMRGASGTIPLGTFQMDEIRSHAHTGVTDEQGEHEHLRNPDGRFEGANIGSPATEPGTYTGSNRFLKSYQFTGRAGKHGHNVFTNPTGGAETRPRNIAVHWIIKT